jgi:16S rRNA (cytosine967-C5)-methyltransferase
MNVPKTKEPGEGAKPDVPGLAARRAAADIVESVLYRNRALDETLESEGLKNSAVDERDRALVRMLVYTVLRRHGTLRHLVSSLLERGLPPNAPRVETSLLIGTAQILLLDVPDHAAVDLSVRLVQENKHTAHFAGLVNAVLRRIGREGRAMLMAIDPIAYDTPPWLLARWIKAYGEDAARGIAQANAHEPPLDLTVLADPAGWAEKLGGKLMPTGTVRLVAHGPVTALPGYDEGAWWVQDAAAALPVRLLGDVRGKQIADLCAAPGGKTLQLAAAGAHVTAVDRSASRLARLTQNLARMKLSAEIVAADATTYEGGPFDAVLIDAPCTATGTIRRHPDVARSKTERDLVKLVALQARLLDRAGGLIKPGGLLVYCTCSLEPEEGEKQIAALLARDSRWHRRPVTAAEIGGFREFVTPDGDLRTLPSQWPDSEPRMAGLDGFYAARLERA